MTSTLHDEQYIFFKYYPAQLFLEWEIFKRICRQIRNTYFLFNIFFFPAKIVAFMR